MIQKCKTGREGLHPRSEKQSLGIYGRISKEMVLNRTVCALKSKQGQKTNAQITLVTIATAIYLALVVYQSERRISQITCMISFFQHNSTMTQVWLYPLPYSQEDWGSERTEQSCIQGHSASHRDSNSSMSESRAHAKALETHWWGISWGLVNWQRLPEGDDIWSGLWRMSTKEEIPKGDGAESQREPPE